MNKTFKKYILICTIIIVNLIGLYLINNYHLHKKTNTSHIPNINDNNKTNKLKIIDLASNTRPIAVMINNNHAAWPLSGLQDAYLVYEIMVEGGITRIMAVYKDTDTSKIGSIRSSRPYFLDYALENDAIYVHYGGSEEAYSDIKKLAIDNIDGISSNAFYRDASLNRAKEHTAFTDISLIKNAIKNQKYRNITNKKTLLNYSTSEITNSNLANSITANHIQIKYSYYQTSSYDYNTTTKTYNRSMNGIIDTDLLTKKQYHYKNIIIYNVASHSYDNTGHQQIDNLGTGNGYYISNGYATKIIWEKTSRSSQTIYKYQNGSEIKVNDGNTFIQIYPSNGNLIIN